MEGWVACLVQLVDFDRGVGGDVEGLEVDAGGGERHAPGLAAQRGDAAARQLHHDALVLVLQPAGVEPLAPLMRLSGQARQVSMSRLSARVPSFAILVS